MSKKVTATELLALHTRGVDTTGLTNRQIYKLVQRNEALSRPKGQPDPYKAAQEALRASHGKKSIKTRITGMVAKAKDELDSRLADILDNEVEIEHPQGVITGNVDRV